MTREELIEKIKNITLPVSEKDFQDIVSSFIDSGFMTDLELATGFGISRQTVTRWRTGINAPLPLLRQPVFRFLIKELQKAT